MVGLAVVEGKFEVMSGPICELEQKSDLRSLGEVCVFILPLIRKCEDDVVASIKLEST